MTVTAKMALTVGGLLLAVGGSLLFALHPLFALVILFAGASPLLFADQ